ncbi:MAG: hypothetical protein E7242_10835 [Lachnospiraceae bacterium]|nr:hypothetical protein [Lachnospiraceae bacterium]
MARVAYEKAKEGLSAAKAISVAIGKAIKNEIIDVIRVVAQRNHDRLTLPIMGSKYLRLISDRPSMQDRAYMEQFVSDIGVTTFEDLKTFKKEQEVKYNAMVSERSGMRERMDYFEGLLRVYEKYEPYIKFHKEQWELKGWEHKKYERKHMVELAYYDTYRKGLKEMITELDKKITAGAWRKELASLQMAYEKSTTPYAEVVTDLACVEVLQHNRKDLDGMLENESHKRTPHKDKNITI